MKRRDYDVVGVREDGLVRGFLERGNIRIGRIGDCSQQIESKTIISQNSSLAKGVQRLVKEPWVFVGSPDHITSIATRADLDSQPVRLWLFGLVSLVEMQMLAAIREYFEGDSWLKLLGRRRLEKARWIYEDRKKRNEEVDLVDCLQFCDKRDILLKSGEVGHILGLNQEQASGFLRDLEGLRNDLAHAQDLRKHDWVEIADLAKKAEEVVDAAAKWIQGQKRQTKEGSRG